MGVAREAHFMPAAREGAEELQAPGERLAEAGHELDRFGRLHRADDTDERREDAHRGAALGFFEPFASPAFGVLREEAVIAGRLRIAQVEDRHLAVEADR